MEALKLHGWKGANKACGHTTYWVVLDSFEAGFQLRADGDEVGQQPQEPRLDSKSAPHMAAATFGSFEGSIYQKKHKLAQKFTQIHSLKLWSLSACEWNGQ